MNKLTLLEEKQIFGKDRLEIFDTYGIESSMTDYALLTGGLLNIWMTKTCYREHFLSIGGHRNHRLRDKIHRFYGIRPAILNASTQMNLPNIENEINYQEEFEYGEYPQTIVTNELAIELEKNYLQEKLTKTGKIYTTQQAKDFFLEEFELREHVEYQYQGKKYIRYIGDNNAVKRILSNGAVVNEGEPYWVEVEPIIWLLDRKSNIAVSKRIILSGIPFNYRPFDYKRKFEDSTVKKFIDNYLSKDIIPSKLIKETNYLSNEKEINKIKKENQLTNLEKIKKRIRKITKKL